MLGRPDVAKLVRGLYQEGPQKLDRPLRVISCHLGGSSSVTGIRNGVAIGTSMGFSPQSGVPQNNRVGDLDAGALPYAAKALGLTIEEASQQLSSESGLLGVSGVGNDMRDVRSAALEGNAEAQIAVELFVYEVRRWASSMLFELGGLDAFHLLRSRLCGRGRSCGIGSPTCAHASLRAVEVQPVDGDVGPTFE